VDSFYVCKSGEVAGVEGEDALYAVNMHGRRKSGVVNLRAADVVGNQQASPLDMNGRGVGKQLYA
jgi:hypothetical protein